ncbi:heavy-metal-associated domain-containing protein [Pseudomonas sp. DTU_2021_1001937_2_SI_NGA_ILE_001]|uniref:heavy-metal-associated domain-containing protein n=1 Tax=Pseudomonas sp. DTU_2021_1001937_2_SI_NGA_ILE_001 TaxID=3077589 RepID=UPI0025D212BC|nr:heavy-metal-associated domain-containing protein [Pseudomonas sp. DTU_2021_1001937_2_SI_NGA_ILE_001]WNW12019.1 heavy-metal-associated domain-containing protein [Pseudomonas sp. DTU_2021_1001937_2_SI_NGA_ILE_001]
MQVFDVQGMTCGHCVRAVTRAIQDADPQARVEIDLPARQAKVDSSLVAQRIVELIGEEGYQARALE